MVQKIHVQRYFMAGKSTGFLHIQNQNKNVMKTNALCPISDKKINERVARLNGFFVLLLVSSFIVFPNLFVVGFMIIDFYLRANDLAKYSPVALLSRNIFKLLPLAVHPINAGPKIFAARIGLVFSVSIFVTYLAGFETASLVIAGVLGLCSFLESVFGFCVACEIYPFVYKFLYQPKSEI